MLPFQEKPNLGAVHDSNGQGVKDKSLRQWFSNWCLSAHGAALQDGLDF